LLKEGKEKKDKTKEIVGNDYNFEITLQLDEVEEEKILNPLTGECIKKEKKEDEVVDASNADETNADGESCLPNRFISCNIADRYRSIDGTCNNLINPKWGAINRSFRRIFPAEYDDDKGKFKDHGKYNSKAILLPNSRYVSLEIHNTPTDVNLPKSSRTSHMIMQFAQFIDHDFTLTPENELNCCRKDLRKTELCKPIKISKLNRHKDPIYQHLEPGQRPQWCIPFTRSNAVCNLKEGQVREQFNGITAVLDLSAVYGSEDLFAKELRIRKKSIIRKSGAFTNLGTLVKHKERWNLPIRNQMENMREFFKANLEAKAAGDHRAPEQPGLAMMHTIFFLEHNWIAEELQKTTAIRDYLRRLDTVEEKDDFVYEEARKINAATFQNIIFREYLPLVLGPDLMKEYKLTVEPGKRSTYNPELDPTIWNEFATFSYRYGHTLISEFFTKIEGRDKRSKFSLDHVFFHDALMTNEVKTRRNGRKISSPWWMPIMRGLVYQKSERADKFMNNALVNKLFLSREKAEKITHPEKNVFLSDLAARNIHRGRDHGLSDYNSYRKWAGLKDLLSLNIKDCNKECCRLTPRKITKRFKKCEGDESKCAYRCWRQIKGCKECIAKTSAEVRKNSALQIPDMSIDDFVKLGETYMWMLGIIDPFPGSMSETVVNGGIVGPTNAKVIADTFVKLKFGDRFFYNHKEEGNAHPLGNVANNMVMRRTMSSILCNCAPVKGSKLKALKFPESAFLQGSKISNCEDILKDKQLDFDALAREIVNDIKNAERKTRPCQWDEDCAKYAEGASGGAYAVCSDETCRVVTGECLEDKDCQGGSCIDDFCSYKKKEKTDFREECQKQKNCDKECN